jgi:SOS regulatory protein LexA
MKHNILWNYILIYKDFFKGGESLKSNENLKKFKGSRFFVLQGEMGTGKTYTSLNRAAYLSEEYCLYNTDNILFITNDNKETIENTYNRLREHSSTFTFFSSISNSFEVMTIDNLVNKYFDSYEKKSKEIYNLVKNKEKEESIILKAIEQLKKKYVKSKLLKKENVTFLLEEIQYIKANHIETLDEYQEFTRKGRSKKVPKNSSSREAIYELIKLYDDLLRENNLIDIFYKEALALREIRKKGTKKYTHIVLDNGEELTKLQLKLVRELLENKPYSNFLVVVNKKETLSQLSYFNTHKFIKDLDGDNKYKMIKFKEKASMVEFTNSIINNIEETLNIQKNIGNITLEESTLLETKGNSEKKKMINLYMEYFNYADIRHRKDYDFAVDSGNSKELILDPNGDGQTLQEDELRSVPVYSDIAAGEPILISDEFEGTFNIPTYWLKGVKDAFMLKVRGDSMIGANIHHGDYVLIRQQTIANNNDIVAVDLDGNATLKRLSIKKEGIFLLPENPKYDPIKIENEDAMVMGTAIGVISRK